MRIKSALVVYPVNKPWGLCCAGPDQDCVEIKRLHQLVKSDFWDLRSLIDNFRF
jgi:hypothetical protein